VKARTFALLAALVALLPCMPLQGASAGKPIDRLVSAYSRNGQFNGVVLVKRGDEVIYERAFGLANREWNVANTKDSRFLIGSVSKAYTALMVLILANEGLIDLNATINTYVPRYDGPGKGQATIHQMLTHTSGIPNHGAIPDLSKRRVRWIYDSDQYVDLIKETAPKFAPGTGFEYSGIAYNLLAIICEKVSRKSFAELLRQRIFAPLHMSDSSLNANLDLDARRASGYEYYLLDGYKLPSYVSMDHCKGSGGILSTVGDMARFNHECFDVQRLTSKALYKAMLTPQVKDWQYYGYGWWIDTVVVNGRKKTLISHGGSTDGYKAYSTRIVEDKIDIIILENDYFRTDVGVKWCYDLTAEIIDILAGKDVAQPRKSIAKAIGLTIGRAGIDQALARLAVLKKDPTYQISAGDYFVLASELGGKHGLKAESIRILEAGLADYPDDFRLNYSFASTLTGTDDPRAIGLYRKCIRIYAENASNKRFAEEYQKAVTAVNGARSGAAVK
jgi:CubicO group peptidase (beta-lactamase class C family)